MSRKRLAPRILLFKEKAVLSFKDHTVISDDPLSLALQYERNGADELLIFNLSEDDEDREDEIEIIGNIARNVNIPVMAGGNISGMEDIHRLLYVGARKVILNVSRKGAIHLLESAADRYGSDYLAVTLTDFDELFKNFKKLDNKCSDLIYMNMIDLDSSYNLTGMRCIVLADSLDDEEVFTALRSPGVKEVSGRYLSQPDLNLTAFKNTCEDRGIEISMFESTLKFSDFKLNSDGHLTVVVQDYQTNDVLMVAYMDEEAFNTTLRTGRMTYYSRSRKQLWVKGLTSGHFQYVKSLTIDCDRDTLLAKVKQVGAACHTGNRSCFFDTIAGMDYKNDNPLLVVEKQYTKIQDRLIHPKEPSYTCDLFSKGEDRIMRKMTDNLTSILLEAKNDDNEKMKTKMSDLLYHTMMLMALHGLSWDDIIKALSTR